MSRSSTTKQKITRNLRYLLTISEHLAKLYKDHQSVFYTIESISHFPLQHREPLWAVNFDKEIELLQDMLDKYQYKFNRRVLVDYYNCVVKTNKLIKEKYRYILEN